jgi:hypothetical protein
VLVNALVVQPSVGSVAETNMERGNTLNAQRFYVRFGSRDLSGPVHDRTYYELFPITSIRVVRHCPM